MHGKWIVVIFVVLEAIAQGRCGSVDQRCFRISIENKFFFIVKIADAANKPDTQFLDGVNLLREKSPSALYYLVVCQAYKVLAVRMKQGGDTMALQRPMSIYRMPCAVQYVAFPYDSMKNQELLLYNSKNKLVASVDLTKLRDRIRALPFFWTKTKPVGIDWDGLPDEIWSKNCFKCK